jgi:hypothetical protein
MITVPAGVRVLITTKPVDFRRGPTALLPWFGRRFTKIHFLERSSSSGRSALTG